MPGFSEISVGTKIEYNAGEYLAMSFNRQILGKYSIG
jgi:hypothetical protein